MSVAVTRRCVNDDPALANSLAHDSGSRCVEAAGASMPRPERVGEMGYPWDSASGEGGRMLGAVADGDQARGYPHHPCGRSS